MKSKESLKGRVGKALEIPEEIADNSIMITLRGRSSLVAENHSGIVSYSEKKILFNSQDGLVSVIGHDLVLVAFDKEELMIEGGILGVVFPGSLGDL